MSKAIVFETRSTPVDTYEVIEVGFGKVAEFTSKASATKYKDYVTDEHRGGRAAQANCDKGHACDMSRIFGVAEYLRTSGRDVVLCPEHRGEVDSVRATLVR